MAIMASKSRKPTLGRAVIHVLVGRKLQDFGIHKDLICYYSPYFKTVFDAGLKESLTGIMKLPTIEVAVFDIFFEWLYYQTLWDKTLKDHNALHARMGNLIKLYVFADRACVPALKDQCIDAIAAIRAKTKTFPMSMISYIWKNTVPGNLLRRYVLDAMVWKANAEMFYFWDSQAYFPAEFRIEAMMMMRQTIMKFQHALEDNPLALQNPLRKPSNYHEIEDKLIIEEE